MLVLVGGVLLLAAVAANLLFSDVQTVAGEPGGNFYAGILGAIAALLLGLPLVWQTFQDLRHGRTQMNELAALAVVAAFVSEMYLTSGAIAFFMVLSNLIETRTALGARRTIERLLRLTPTRAIMVNADGSESEVEARDLKPGDVVRVRPGDNLPGDGTVVRGYSTINQANITGESGPRRQDRGRGSLRRHDQHDRRAGRPHHPRRQGHDARPRGRIWCSTPSTPRPRRKRLADRYAAYHTPVVLMIALIVLLLFTNRMERAIALLVIACPSSIILATPTAMVAALSAAARLGILIKNVSVLERARNLSAVVLDKTGTLTTGKLSVTRLGPVDGVTARGTPRGGVGGRAELETIRRRRRFRKWRSVRASPARR